MLLPGSPVWPFRSAECQSCFRSPCVQRVQEISVWVLPFFCLIQKIWSFFPKQNKIKFWKHQNCLRCEVTCLCCMVRKNPLSWGFLTQGRRGCLQYPGRLGCYLDHSPVLFFALPQTLWVTYMHTAITFSFASLLSVKYYYFFGGVNELITCKLLWDSQKWDCLCLLLLLLQMRCWS